MLWLWILGILLALTVLLCLLRLGVLIRFDEVVWAWLRLGPLRIQLAPSKPKREKKAAAPEKKARKEQKRAQRQSKLFDRLKNSAKPTAAEVRALIEILWPPAKRALSRTRRSIRIDPLELSVVLGGREDPAAAAERYGCGMAAVWTVMPALERLLTIPHPAVSLNVDYGRETPLIRGRVGVSIRIGTLLGLGLGMTVPAVRCLLLLRKLQKTRPPQRGETAGQDAPAQTAA